MTEQEAKKVIREDPGGNITNRIEAINVALSILGQTATMGEIYKWAEEGKQNEKDSGHNCNNNCSIGLYDKHDRLRSKGIRESFL